MKQNAFHYFGAGERRAALLLMGLCWLGFSAPIFYERWHSAPSLIDTEALRREIAAFEASLPPTPAKQLLEPKLGEAVALFAFDPNLAGEEELRHLGIPDRVARNILKYRERGGRFRRAEDLEKIYGLSPELYRRLAPWARFAAVSSDSPPRPAQPPAGMATIDINTAGADEWRTLPGIGPVLSERIVRFREKLGGFATAEQVAETYGLPDSAFQKIRERLRVSSLPRRIAINEASFEELAAHPYLDRRQAAALLDHRRRHGRFFGLEDLSALDTFPNKSLLRVAPYFQFD